MRKLEDLASRPDLLLGELCVSPSRRLFSGPAGEVHVEPLIMQVFLLLLDAAGRVVTRNELFDECWGGAAIGDDSLNRCISKVRRVGAETAPGLFEIETIPRTGYRLTGDIVPLAKERPPAGEAEAAPSGVSRRRLIGAGAAAGALAVGGTGLWLALRERRESPADALVEEGRQILLESWPGSDAQGVRHFRRAIAINPDNAEAWGLFAVALRNVAEDAPKNGTSAAVRECEAAAKRALEIDPREGNALAALAMLEPEFGAWGVTEHKLRQVLAVAPDNVFALNPLVVLLQSVGRALESWNLNEKAAALQPRSPVCLYRRALKHWIFGRVEEADQTIDRALHLWPRHPAVWTSRLYIFAFTGRPAAALAMINDSEGRPATFDSASENRWRASLQALRTRSPSDIQIATDANVRPAAGGLATAAIMILSELGQLDAAFHIANGWLLRRGPLVGPLWPTSGQMQINDHQWRRTMNLFTPATAAMRDDPRFEELCEGMGMTQYWQQRGIWPDPMFGVA